MRAKLNLIIFLLGFLPYLLIGAKSPDFTVTDFNNKVHKLYENYLNKDKVVVIKFFFVGCPPCATIGPYFEQAYIRWGSGNGRVQFFEMSILQGDYNSLVKAYHQTKGYTFPGIGSDGGAKAVVAPYMAGNFGSWSYTPSFAVIAPNGEVKYNVAISTSDQSALDSAIAQSLRMPGSGGCSNAFEVSTITQIQPETYFVVDLLNGNPANELKSGNYSCQFNLPQNIEGHYVIPQMNAYAEPLNGVTTGDIVFIQRSILGLQTLNNLQLAVADVNFSGSISAADVSEIRRLILGVTSKFNKLNKSYVVVHNPKSTNILDLTDRVLVQDLVSKTKVNVFGIGQYGDVTGAALFANEDLELRTSGVMKFNVELNQLQDGSYEHNFYATEDVELTGFQLELKSNPGEIKGIKSSSILQNALSLDFNLNLNPEIIRVVASTKTSKDAFLKSGELWFSVYTKSSAKLKPSNYKNFKHEYIFNSASKFYNSTEIYYMLTSLKGETVKLSQDQISNVIISSEGTEIKNIQVFNCNQFQVFNQSLASGARAITIKTNNWIEGLYLVKIQLSNGHTTLKKLIVY